MNPIEPIPVIVISGFLGSGKTTLINQLLYHQPRSALIINEFGSTPLDQDFIKAHQVPVSTLTGGCLCCQVRDALTPVLKNLRMAWDSKVEKPFEQIIIETSGVANPEPVLDSLLHERWLKERYSLKAMISTVSAIQEDIFSRFPEAVAQLVWADRIVLTQTDIATISQLNSTQQQLQQIAPHTLKLNAIHGTIPPELLLAHSSSLLDRTTSFVKHIPAHSFQSVSLRLEQPIAWSRLQQVLKKLMQDYAKQLIRLKGIIHSTEHQQALIIQAANGILHSPTYLNNNASHDGIGRLVFITDGKVNSLAQDFIEQLHLTNK